MISKTDSSIEIVKKKGLRVPDRLQSGSILRFSSSFIFNIRIVCHFNKVNISDTVESGYTWIQHVPLSILRIRWSQGIRRLDTCRAMKAICEKQGDVLEVFIPAKWFPKSAYTTSWNLTIGLGTRSIAAVSLPQHLHRRIWRQDQHSNARGKYSMNTL